MPSPLFSAALQNSLTAALCHWNYTHEDLLIIQVCSDPTPMHCNTGFGKMHSPLLSAALHSSLTVHVSCDPTVMHCSTALGKMLFPLFSAALQNSLTAALCHCICTCEDLLIIQVCSDPTPMYCNTVFGKMLFQLFSAALQNSLTVALCHCNYTYKDLLIIQVCIDPTLLLAKCTPHCSHSCNLHALRYQAHLFTKTVLKLRFVSTTW